MPFLTKEQILSVPDTNKFLSLDVPEWGGTVNIKKINGLQRERLEAAFAKNSSEMQRAPLLSYCICDEAGKALFSEADFAALNSKSAEALTTVFMACMRHNGFLKDDVEAAEKKS